MMFNIKITLRQWELRLRIQIPLLEVQLTLRQILLYPHNLFPPRQFLSDGVPVSVNPMTGMDLTKGVKLERYKWMQI